MNKVAFGIWIESIFVDTLLYIEHFMLLCSILAGSKVTNEFFHLYFMAVVGRWA